jgi:UDP-N-acetylglucosamine acyltransferase
MSAKIHPTAIVDSTADLADDVIVGPYAIIEGLVRLGPGCVVQSHAQLIGPLTAGERNIFGRACIIGDEPQHLAATGAGTHVYIGNGNGFREHVTVHRGTAPGKATRIGDNNYFMVGSHVAHDCTIGNKVIMANCALLGGHVTVEDGVFLSGNTAVHQRMRIGKLALLSGTSAATKDLPPFTIMQNFNQVCGVNVIGMRRAGYSREDINAVRQAFRTLYLHGNLVPVALEKIAQQFVGSKAIGELVHFIRSSTNGISNAVGRAERRAA